MDQSQPHFTTVGELNFTNALRFSPDTPCMDIAIELLSSHMTGGPVVDGEGRFLGFVSEYDLLKALVSSKNLRIVTAQDIMAKEPFLIQDRTPIKEAIHMVLKNHLLNLCVEEQGCVTKTYTRHDLLRGYIGVDFGIDED